MKYLYKSRLSIFFLITGLGFALTGQGQEKFYNWQVGIGIGYSNYYGDLSNYRINKGKDLYKVYKFADYNKNYQQQPSFSVLFQKKVTPTLGIMLQANYLQFSMSDRYRRNNGTLEIGSANYARSLNFRTNLQDAGFAFTFSPNNGRIGPENAFFYPSFYIGAGVSRFDVKGDLYDANNNPYNYQLPETLNDDNFETNLRDLRTETETRYRNVEPYVDLGLALNFRISPLLTLAVQSDIKYSASDYLDDVSARYKPAYPTAAEGYAARPGYNTVNPVTLQRGDNNGVNDFYINNRVVLNFTLPSKKNVKTFNSPVIYSLNNISSYQVRVTDSVKNKMILNADSLKRAKADSIKQAVSDSIRMVQDSISRSSVLPDSLLKNQLDQINTELKGIKEILRAQQVIPRLQQLQYQADSIKNLRTRLINQRPATKENNLLMRIYDLQIDSLRNESQKLQQRQNQPFTKADSAMFLNNPGISTRQANAAEEQLSSSANTPAYDSARQQNLKQIDSIQKRLEELERASANTDQPADVAIANRPNWATDSINAINNKLETENELQRRDQAINQLQQQLTALKDSADYYKNIQRNSEAVEPVDTAAKKTTWLQRYFGIGDKKKRRAANVKDDAVQSSNREQQTQMIDASGNQTATELRSQDTSARKTTWFQRFFGNGGKKKERAGNVKDNTVQANNNREQQTDLNDSTDYQNSTELRSQDTAAKKTTWFKRVFGSGGKKKEQAISAKADTAVQRADYSRLQQKYYESQASMASKNITAIEREKAELAERRINYLRQNQLATDSAEYLRNLKLVQNRIQQNTDSINLLKRQVQKTADSAAYYNRQMVAESQNNAEANRKWYQGLFTSEKKKQRQIEEENNKRQVGIRNEESYNNEIRNLQSRINDMERRNVDLQNSYQSYNSDRYVTRRNNYPVAPVIVYDDNNSGNNQEVAQLRARLQNLQNEVSDNSVKKTSPDTTAAAIQPQAVTTLPAAVAGPVAAADSSEVSLLRNELNQLRLQLDSLKSRPAPVVAAPIEKPEPKYDVTGFPVISVYFKMGSVVLPADQLNKISPFAQVANKNKDATILLKGFTDPVGDPAKNRVIANKRSQYIKNYLVSRYKVNDSRILIEEPEVSGQTATKKANPLDRRVDLQFQ